mmetsp:Transcript_21115/g.54448  ORF Transcript_21115/g.54448 Transcript_21115/m.54448 type:complete len:278 (-) Transcript_21115:772-1605(-)
MHSQHLARQATTMRRARTRTASSHPRCKARSTLGLAAPATAHQPSVAHRPSSARRPSAARPPHHERTRTAVASLCAAECPTCTGARSPWTSCASTRASVLSHPSQMCTLAAHARMPTCGKTQRSGRSCTRVRSPHVTCSACWGCASRVRRARSGYPAVWSGIIRRCTRTRTSAKRHPRPRLRLARSPLLRMHRSPHSTRRLLTPSTARWHARDSSAWATAMPTVAARVGAHAAVGLGLARAAPSRQSAVRGARRRRRRLSGRSQSRSSRTSAWPRPV